MVVTILLVCGHIHEFSMITGTKFVEPVQRCRFSKRGQWLLALCERRGYKLLDWWDNLHSFIKHFAIDCR